MYLENDTVLMLFFLHFVFRVDKKGSCNLRTEPKFIVFLSQLLMLFQLCPFCKMQKPLIEVKQTGTLVEIATSCGYDKCPCRENVWRSQPNIPGTKIAAGNFLLSFAVLVAGASASKVFQVFSHMGLACIKLRTYFERQRVRLVIVNFVMEMDMCNYVF